LPVAPVVSAVTPVSEVLPAVVRAREGPRAVSVLVGRAVRVASAVRVLKAQ